MVIPRVLLSLVDEKFEKVSPPIEHENDADSTLSPMAQAVAAFATEPEKLTAAKTAKQPNIFFITFCISSD